MENFGAAPPCGVPSVASPRRRRARLSAGMTQQVVVPSPIRTHTHAKATRPTDDRTIRADILAANGITDVRPALTLSPPPPLRVANLAPLPQEVPPTTFIRPETPAQPQCSGPLPDPADALSWLGVVRRHRDERYNWEAKSVAFSYYLGCQGSHVSTGSGRGAR